MDWKKHHWQEREKKKSWSWQFHQIVGNGSFYLRSLFLGRYHDQTPATQRKCKHSERARNFKRGPGSESKISIGAGIIPARRHGSVGLLSLSTDRLPSLRWCLFESRWIYCQEYFNLILVGMHVKVWAIYHYVHFSGWLWDMQHITHRQFVWFLMLKVRKASEVVWLELMD